MRAPFLSLEELNTSSAEELAATIASADDEHQRLETEDKIESQELAQLEERIDNAQVAATAIDETAERLETTYPEGVPDEVVQTLEPVLEALKNVVGFKPGSMKVAVEGLSGKERTRVAVEGLKETANKIWEAIKAAFKRMIEFFKNIFTRQGRQRAALVKKLDATIESLEKEIHKTGTHVAAYDILYPRTCLLSDGKAPNLEKMTHWVNSEARTLLDFYKTIDKHMGELHDLCVKNFANVSSMADFSKAQLEYIAFSKRSTSELLSMTSSGTVKSSLGGFQGKFSIASHEGPLDVTAAYQLHFTVEDQDVSPGDAVQGLSIPRDKNTALLKDLEKAHGSWPGDEEGVRVTKMLETINHRLYQRTMDLVHVDEELAKKMTDQVKQVLMHMHAYGRFMSWAYRSVMMVMMGITSVCGSSVGYHALNEAYSK